MKHFDNVWFPVTAIAHLAVMCTEWIALACGYTVTWTKPIPIVITLTVLTIIAAVRMFYIQSDAKITVFAITLQLLTILETFVLAARPVYWLHILMAIAAFIGLCKIVRPLWLKFVCAFVSFLLIGVTVAAIGISMIFGTWVNGDNEIVKSVASPDASKEAQIIAISNGAAGGYTTVVVRDANARFDAILFVIEKPAHTLTNYETYGMHEIVTVTWIDNDTVSVHCAGEYDRTAEFDV